MCLNPRITYNPKYLPNQKNKGIPPIPKDKRVLGVPIECKECIECRRKRKREWKVRLKEEVKANNQATFVTLTFSTKSIVKLYNDDKINNLKGYDLDNAAATLAVRLWTERWRKKFKKAPRHWLITELGHGTTEHIHLHGLVWSKDVKAIHETWQYGFTWMGKYVNGRTVNYIGKYLVKIDLKHKAYRPKVLTSNGIGAAYTKTPQARMNRYDGANTTEIYRDERGYNSGLPTYYRNKLYSEEEREELWLHKLDKGIRYVNGREINTNTETGWEQYRKLLEQAREANRELGYGLGSQKWKFSNYENERRIILQEKRKAKALKDSEINDRKKNDIEYQKSTKSLTEPKNGLKSQTEEKQEKKDTFFYEIDRDYKIELTEEEKNRRWRTKSWDISGES